MGVGVPTYHACLDSQISPPAKWYENQPTFGPQGEDGSNSRPPTLEGHLALGSILSGFDEAGIAYPLNVGHVIDASENETGVYPRNGPDRKMGFNFKTKELRSAEASLFARLLSFVSFRLGLKRQKDDEETLEVKELQTRYFIPSETYIKRALEYPNVATFVRTTRMKVPVYMVTGIKVAVGATMMGSHTRFLETSGEAAATDPNGAISAGETTNFISGTTKTAGFDGSTDFVLGIRLFKIWWDKSGTRHVEKKIAGTTLADKGSETVLDLFEGLDFVEEKVKPDDIAGKEKLVVIEDDQFGIEPSTWILS